MLTKEERELLDTLSRLYSSTKDYSSSSMNVRPSMFRDTVESKIKLLLERIK